MSAHADAPFPPTLRAASRGAGDRHRRPGADAMGLFRVTPRATDGGVGIAVVDRVPVP